MRESLGILITTAVLSVGGGSEPAEASPWLDITPDMNTAPMRIGFDHTNADRLFLGSWGEGLYRSTDGGQTWTQNFDDFFEGEGVASVIVVDADLSPLDLTLGVAVTLSGVYVSSDGGVTWTRDAANHTGDAPGSSYMIAPLPDGSGVVVSELGSLSGGTFWVYEWDTGEWSVGSAALQGVDGASTLGIGFDGSQPPVLYIGNTFRNFWTDDLGQTLHNNSAGLPDNTTRAVIGDPEIPGRAICAVDGGVYLATSPGGGWTPYGAGLPGPVYALVQHPMSPDHIYAGTLEGIYHSQDRGATFTPMTTDGLTYDRVMDLAIHPLAPNTLYASTTNGTSEVGGLFEIELDVVVSVTDAHAPGVVALRNRPNPFRAATVIAYQLDAPGSVRLNIYDPRGRHVTTLTPAAVSGGTGTVVWDGRDASGHRAASGVYYYRLEVDGRPVAQRPLTLVR